MLFEYLPYHDDNVREYEMTFSFEEKEYDALVVYEIPDENPYIVYLDDPRKEFQYEVLKNGELEYTGHTDFKLAETIRLSLVELIQKIQFDYISHVRGSI